VIYRGTLYKLAGLPMGWKCSSYYFCRLTEVFIRHLREPLPNPTGHNPRLATNEQPTRLTPSRRYLRNSRWRGARLLPYMDDFFFLPIAKTHLYMSATALRAYSIASG
jgi:hypothetical protein